MRRTTLGPVSSATLNRRPSLRPPPKNPASSNPLKIPPDRRASAFPSFGQTKRRSTATNRPPSSSLSRTSVAFNSRHTKRSDPRPLNDKHYMSICVKKLISFVIDRGYEQPISWKILTNPSAKDFQHIFLFLLRMIDPTFSFQKRFEDEVPLVLRALNYPFSISKSALSAVGSPHTWPTLLGVLTWLMNLLQYDELRKERVESDAALDPSSRRHKLFYENTVEAYAQFLGGADEFPELNKELDDHFSSENKNRGAEITKLENDRDELSNTLDALRTQPSPLELINEHKTSLETNIRKFNLLIPSLLEHAASVNKKIVEKDSEVEREKRELEALGKGKGRLLDVLARQEEAAIDAECISKDREMLREALNTVSGDRAGVETTLSETEGVVARVSGGLEENVKAFNREIEQLGLGEERRLLISREPTVTDADSIVVGVKEAVKVLRELKEHFVGRIPGLQEEALKLQEETDEVEEKLILMRHEQNVLKSKKEQLEAEYLQKKESMNDALTRKSDWIMKREEDIRSTKDSMRERIRESDSRILALKEQLAGFEEQFAKERRRISAIVTQDVDKFRQHQRSVRHSVITVRRHFEEQLKAEK